MKLRLSFIARDDRAVPYLFYTLWGGVVLAVLLTGYMLWHQHGLREDNRQLAEQTEKYQHQLAQNQVLLKDAPSLAEFRQLQQRINVINELAGQQGASLSRVLSRLEQLMPDEAWLTNLTYRPEHNEILLTVEAPGAEQLTRLLQAAENSQRFSEVLLTRQSQERRQGQGVLQFEIRLKTITARHRE